MHHLFAEVLRKRDLSRAGDLFSIDDKYIVADLSELIHEIRRIASAIDFNLKHNDQSVIEICLTRITSAIRDTRTIEKHAPALVSLLESCFNHVLAPNNRDEDPPHAKIASDIISCIFLNHSKRSVMKLAVPVAVKLLHRGNRELSRNLSSYLSLAAINNAEILAPHIQPIIDSIIGGNYSLSRVLPKIYSVRQQPVHEHLMALVCLLPLCETPEKLSLLNLFALISKSNPILLESNLPQFTECLSHHQTAYPTLQIFLDMATANPMPFAEYIPKVAQVTELQPGTLPIAAQLLGIVGRLDVTKAGDTLRFLTTSLTKTDLSTTITLLRETKSLVEFYPSLLPSFLPAILAASETSSSSTVQSYLTQLTSLNQQVTSSSTVSVVRVNYGLGSSEERSQREKERLYSNGAPDPSTTPLASPTKLSGMYKFGNNSNHVIHRSIPRLHVVSGGHIIGRQLSSSSNGVHRSLTALQSPGVQSASRGGVSRRSVESITATPASSQKSASSSYLLALQEREMAGKSSKTVATSVDSQLQGASSSSSSHNIKSSPTEINVHPRVRDSPRSAIESGGISSRIGGMYECDNGSKYGQNTSILVNNSKYDSYPMRDTVQHFCEKHIDKIKSYMEKILVKIPLPVKCSIEERRAGKKVAKIYMGCQVKGEHCLYSDNYFIMKTRNARIWIHLMFLALQAKASSPLSTKDPSVNALKLCWDTLKVDNKSFLTLVTSSFPSAKDQDNLIQELRHARYFDVFEFNAISNPMWGCFLCNHPDRVSNYFHNDEPVMEGTLKEKKGKWKLFRRWRTRYFTLSGVHLSYRDSTEKDVQPVEVGVVRSVKAIGNSKGRTIPKAFEIFTNEEKTYVLKAQNSRNNEQWLQRLSIAMAHSLAKGGK